MVLEQEVLGSSQVQHMSALVVQSKDYSKKNCFIVFRIGYFREFGMFRKSNFS